MWTDYRAAANMAEKLAVGLDRKGMDYDAELMRLLDKGGLTATCFNPDCIRCRRPVAVSMFAKEDLT